MNDTNRKYRITHPWITFTIDLRRFSPQLWMALGEAKSKCEHIANTPLQPEVANRLHRLFLAKGVHGTTAIEGNTLSQEEIIQKIDGTLQLPPSKDYLGQEIENIVEACNSIGNLIVESPPRRLQRTDLERYNKIVLDKLDVSEGVVPGEIRHYSVGVAGARYRGAPVEDCEYLLDRLCSWLNESWAPDEASNALVYGIIKAIVAHVYLAWIHPFGDGNGRTARLLEFQILLESGAPTPVAHLLSNFYNETRRVYYAKLDESSKSTDTIYSFIEYAVLGFVDALRGQLKLVWEQVWNVTWESHIHDTFKNKDKPSDVRRRHLALDISRGVASGTSVSPTEVRNVSPRIAAHYSRKTPRTLQRDLMALEELGLIVVNLDGSVRPNREIVFSFLPRKRDNQD